MVCITKRIKVKYVTQFQWAFNIFNSYVIISIISVIISVGYSGEHLENLQKSSLVFMVVLRTLQTAHMASVEWNWKNCVNGVADLVKRVLHPQVQEQQKFPCLQKEASIC